MSRFARELPDTGWYRGLKVPETVIRNIDQKTLLAVSGTGSTHAPSAAIILGGAGLELQCAMLLANAAAVLPAVGKNYKFGDDDYFKFDALRARTIVDSPCLMLAKDTLQREARPWGSVSTLALSLRTKRANAHLLMPIRVPDGSFLSSVEIGFKVGQSHAGIPDNMPKARVVRISTDGKLQQHPNPSSAVYDPDGWNQFPVPASGAAWYAAGVLQTMTLSYDYTLVPAADTSTYGYAVEWYDEWGTNAFADDIGTYLIYLKLTVYEPDLRPY